MDPAFFGFAFDTGPRVLGHIETVEADLGPLGTVSTYFGGEVRADLSGRAGFDVGLYLNSGSVSADYTGDLNLSFDDPTTFANVPISAGLVIENGSFSTISPRAGAYAEFVLELDAKVGAEACVVFCVGGDFPLKFDINEELFAVNRDFDGEIRIVEGLGSYQDLAGRAYSDDKSDQRSANQKPDDKKNKRELCPEVGVGICVDIGQSDDLLGAELTLKAVAAGADASASKRIGSLELTVPNIELEAQLGAGGDSSAALSASTSDDAYDGERLSQFDNTDPRGVWTLEIKDTESSSFSEPEPGTGTLNRWRLAFNGGGPTAVTTNDVSTTIADDGTTTSELDLTGISITNITDLDVHLDITHTRNPDLDVTLISPSGIRVELFSGVGEADPALIGGASNFTGTILDDEADDDIGNEFADAPYTGRFKPQSYDGLNQLASLKVDAAALLGPLVGISAGEYEVSLADDALVVNVTTIKYDVGPTLEVVQDAMVTPQSTMTFTFDRPVPVKVGGSSEFKFMSEVTFEPGVNNPQIKFGGIPIQVTPRLDFEASFSNKLDLEVDIDGTLEAFAFSLEAFGETVIDVGPLLTHEQEFGEIPVATIFEDEFLLTPENTPGGLQDAPLQPFIIGEFAEINGIAQETPDLADGDGIIRPFFTAGITAIDTEKELIGGVVTRTRSIDLGGISEFHVNPSVPASAVAGELALNTNGRSSSDLNFFIDRNGAGEGALRNYRNPAEGNLETNETDSFFGSNPFSNDLWESERQALIDSGNVIVEENFGPTRIADNSRLTQFRNEADIAGFIDTDGLTIYRGPGIREGVQPEFSLADAIGVRADGDVLSFGPQGLFGYDVGGGLRFPNQGERGEFELLTTGTGDSKRFRFLTDAQKNGLFDVVPQDFTGFGMDAPWWLGNVVPIDADANESPSGIDYTITGNRFESITVDQDGLELFKFTVGGTPQKLADLNRGDTYFFGPGYYSQNTGAGVSKFRIAGLDAISLEDRPFLAGVTFSEPVNPVITTELVVPTPLDPAEQITNFVHTFPPLETPDEEGLIEEPVDDTGQPINLDETVAPEPITRAEEIAGPTEVRTIIDNATVTSTLTIEDSFAITDVNVVLAVAHPRVADLQIVLIAPDGVTQVPLVSNSASGANFANTIFDDEADTNIADGTAPFDGLYGSFQPSGALADFVGLDAQGEWTLQITDNVAGQSGRLNSWSLVMPVTKIGIGLDPRDGNGDPLTDENGNQIIFDGTITPDPNGISGVRNPSTTDSAGNPIQDMAGNPIVIVDGSAAVVAIPVIDGGSSQSVTLGTFGQELTYHELLLDGEVLVSAPAGIPLPPLPFTPSEGLALVDRLGGDQRLGQLGVTDPIFFLAADAGGYEYEASEGYLFDSIFFDPTVGGNQFLASTFDVLAFDATSGGFVFVGSVQAGTVFDFDNPGVNRFQLLGRALPNRQLHSDFNLAPPQLEIITGVTLSGTGGGQPVITMTEISERVAFSADPVLDAGAAAANGVPDKFRVVRDGPNLQVFIQEGSGPESLLDEFAATSITAITFEGSSDDDKLIVDYSGGPIGLPVIFNGNGGDDLDVLELSGGTFDDVTPIFDNDQDGEVEVAGSLIQFTSLAAIDGLPPSKPSVELDPGEIDENGITILTGEFLDLSLNFHTHTVTIDWGDESPVTIVTPAALPAGVSTSTPRSVSASHRYLDDNPSGDDANDYTINVTVTSDNALSSSNTTTVTVIDVAPTLTFDPITMIDENGVATATGTIDDPGTLDTFTLDVNWGDPLSPGNTQTIPLGDVAIDVGGVTWDPETRAFSVKHQYLDDNPSFTSQDTYTVQASVTDDDLRQGADTVTVLVKNVAPTLTVGTAHNVDQGTLLTFSATATDPSPTDVLIFSLDPGAPDGMIIYPGTGEINYAPNRLGTFTADVRVTDDDTGTDFETVTIIVNAVPAVAAGPESLTNDFLTSFQDTYAETRAVAANASGDYIVAFSGWGVDDMQGIFARRFSSDDTPLGPQFRVNVTTSSNQRYASAAMGAGGESVVAWSGRGVGDNDGGVFVRLIDDTGAPVSGEIRVNETTPSFQHRPVVTKASDGSFIVVWSGKGVGDFDSGVFARRFAANGTPLTGEFRVNTTTASYQQQPDIAIAGDGSFVIAWSGRGVGGDYSGVYFQRYDTTGSPVGTETRVNTTTAGPQVLPSVGIGGDNDFVITWSGMGVGDMRGVFLQRFDAAGNPVGGEELVNTRTLYDQEDPSISVAPSGVFVVTWTSLYQDGSQKGVYGQEYDNFGAKMAGEFSINTTTTGDQKFSSVATKGEAGFVVAWSGRGTGDLTGVFARSFNRPVAVLPPAALAAIDQFFADEEDELLENLGLLF